MSGAFQKKVGGESGSLTECYDVLRYKKREPEYQTVYICDTFA